MATVPWIMYRIGREMGSEALGRAAALLMLVHPSYGYHPTVAGNVA